MVDPSKMSVEEILAYCRQADGENGGGSAAEGASSEESSPPAAAPAPKTPSAPKAASGPMDRSGMSVADMLAAARSADSAGGETGGETAEADDEAEEEAVPAASGVAQNDGFLRFVGCRYVGGGSRRRETCGEASGQGKAGGESKTSRGQAGRETSGDWSQRYGQHFGCRQNVGKAGADSKGRGQSSSERAGQGERQTKSRRAPNA